MACPFWETHEASPGEPTAFLDAVALDYYGAIQRHGWPMVAALRSLELSEQEAEGLGMRLEWLTQHLPAMLEQWRGKEEQLNKKELTNGYYD